MDITNYFNQKRDLHTVLLQFLNDEDESDEFFQNFIFIINTQKIQENNKDFKILLQIILSISNNYHHKPSLFDKITHILLLFKDKIKQTFSNTDIFDFFKSNKRILLFLSTNGILEIDKSVSKMILKHKNQRRFKHSFYFYQEMKTFIDEKNLKKLETKLLNYDEDILENFKEKRKIGENDSYLCQLIRNDSIDDFVSYMNKTNILNTSTIKPSIFETNEFLLQNKKTTLIEYAAFFGSIQIFQYLRMNNVELKPSLWLYAIHGNNAELIHLLEEYQVQPENKSYQRCFEEAVKCHHNEIAAYILDNLLIVNGKNENDFDKCVLGLCFKYYNFAFFPNDYDINIMLHYLCYYNYIELVEILLKDKGLNINIKMIQNHFIFNKIHQFSFLIEFKIQYFDCISIYYVNKIPK